MRIVSPYKPYPPEQLDRHHLPEKVGAFDWIEALQMLGVTAARFGYEVLALTDTALPVPHLVLPTQHSSLMTWIMEVSLMYLESEHFDRDTLFLSPDSLINAPLPELGNADLGICARHAPKYKDKPILNSIQFWPVSSKAKLAGFYHECLGIAAELDGKWGADTIPLTRLLSPIEPGIVPRQDIRVHFFSHHKIMKTITGGDILALDSNKCPVQTDVPIIDFKSTKKRYMRDYYRKVYENS